MEKDSYLVQNKSLYLGLYLFIDGWYVAQDIPNSKIEKRGKRWTNPTNKMFNGPLKQTITMDKKELNIIKCWMPEE